MKVMGCLPIRPLSLFFLLSGFSLNVLAAEPSPAVPQPTTLEEAAAQRKAADQMREAAETGELLVATHLPFPSVGRVVINGDAFQFFYTAFAALLQLVALAGAGGLFHNVAVGVLMHMGRVHLSYSAGNILLTPNGSTIFLFALAALSGHTAAGNLHCAIFIKPIAAGFASRTTNSHETAAGDRYILHTATAGLSGSTLCYHSAAAYAHRRQAEAISAMPSAVSAGSFHRSASDFKLNIVRTSY